MKIAVDELRPKMLATLQGRFDAEGNETTDPAAAMKGALLPFGNDYKGASMAMVVEILRGVLAGADYCNADG
jgi:(2R)-3-sulfolactate dehydrogenase (NADP+)